MVSAVAGIVVWLSRIWLFPCSRQLVLQHKRGGIGAIVGLGSLSIIFPILQRERAEPSITASLVYCVGFTLGPVSVPRDGNFKPLEEY